MKKNKDKTSIINDLVGKTSQEIQDHVLELPIDVFDELIESDIADILKRVKDLIYHLRMKQLDFEGTLRLKSGITAKESRKNYGIDLVIRIKLVYPHVSLMWLLFGLGDMYEVNKKPFTLYVKNEVPAQSQDELQAIKNDLQEIKESIKNLTK